MIQADLNKKIEELSKKHHLPKFVIEAIWESQFRFIAQKMRDAESTDDLKSFYLRNFGKFFPFKRKK